MSVVTAPPRGRPAATGNARPRRRRVLALLTALLALWGLAAAPSASAHATVISTDPSDGSLLKAAPSQISIVYSEPVELELGALRVFAPDGSRVDVGSAEHPPGHDDTVTIGLHSGLKTGTYVVSWRVISADSHPVHGGFTFSIGTTSATAGAQSAPVGDKTVGELFGVSRWLAFLGFTALVGPAFLALLCAPWLLERKRARRLAVAGWLTLLLGTVSTLLLQGPYGAGFGLGKAFDSDVLQATMHTRLGTALAWRLVLLGAAGVLLSWLATRLPRAGAAVRLAAGALGGALAVAIALTWAAADHAGVGDQAAVSLPVDVTHLLAMAVWGGGLILLAVAVLRRPGGTGGAPADGAQAVGQTAGTARAVATMAAAPVLQRVGADGEASGAEAEAMEVEAHADPSADSGDFGDFGESGASEARGTPDPASEPPFGTASGFSDAEALTLVRRFSPVAFTAVAVLVASGTYQSWRQVRSWDALFGTDYGKLLLVKISLVAVMLSLGYLARRHLKAGTPDLRILRRSVTTEFGIALCVLAVTSVLVESQPGRETVNRVAGDSQPFDTGSARGTVNMTLDPARAGVDSLHLYILDANGMQESVKEVDVMLSLPSQDIGPLAVKVENAGPGHYIVPAATIPYAGQWQIIVVVRTTDVDETTVILNARVG